MRLKGLKYGIYSNKTIRRYMLGVGHDNHSYLATMFTSKRLLAGLSLFAGMLLNVNTKDYIKKGNRNKRRIKSKHTVKIRGNMINLPDQEFRGKYPKVTSFYGNQYISNINQLECSKKIITNLERKRRPKEVEKYFVVSCPYTSLLILIF